MVDDLLPYYDRELSYIRRLAAEFAVSHPKIAGRLRLTQDAVEDPHVARLIEAFAFLTARIRRKLDDDLPELTEALLNVLYPHYLSPIPSMAIMQASCPNDLAGSSVVPARVDVETEPLAGESCRFRTCYSTTLWPITIEAASLRGLPLVAPANPFASGTVAVLRLTLRCLAPDMTFTKLAPDRLRFYLRGQSQHALSLYELIFNNAVSLAVADSATDASPVILRPECIQPVGFDQGDGMLPYPARSFVGYRLLTEYFTFPEKFLFFDLTQLSAKILLDAKNKLDVFIYLNKTSAELERSVTAESFALGCTPIVNLFRQRAEPIHLTRSVSEYRVVPDARRPGVTEVFSVDSVVATAPDGTETPFMPFYSVKHAAAAHDQRAFWFPARRAAADRVPGTETFLSLVDLDFNPSVPADTILSVETTCLNRDLPSRLPYGGGHPYLQLVEPSAGVASLHCITPPTPTVRPPLRNRALWRLISHLSLNHLSVTRGDSGAEALREILKLYDFRDSSETRVAIGSVLDVHSRRSTARAPSADMGAFCRGLDIEIVFDEQRFVGNGLFLLAAVLERFLALYGSINSFTRLTVRLEGRPGVLRRWLPRAGEQVLL
jgi:type VI secretion system protein ImpG